MAIEYRFRYLDEHDFPEGHDENLPQPDTQIEVPELSEIPFTQDEKPPAFTDEDFAWHESKWYKIPSTETPQLEILHEIPIGIPVRIPDGKMYEDYTDTVQ